VRDSEGRHYLAELVLAWSGEDEFWRQYLTGIGSGALAEEAVSL
jgi:hypothetical protein